MGEAYELERDGDKDSMPKAKATPKEPTVAWIHEVAEGGLEAIGHHGPMAAMGIATQKPELRKRLKIDTAAERLARFLETSVALMQVMARACGHNHLNQFNADDLASWDRNTAELAGIEWSGFDPTRQS